MKKLLRTLPFLTGALLLVSICVGSAQAQQLCNSCQFILLGPFPNCAPPDFSACTVVGQEAACQEAAIRKANDACAAAQNEAYTNCLMNCVIVSEGPAPTPMPTMPPPGGGGGFPDIEIPTDCPDMEFLMAAAVIFAVGPRFKKRKK